jgi:hypothetical protein
MAALGAVHIAPGTKQVATVRQLPIPDADLGVDTVLWSDDSAQHVIGESYTTFQGNPPYTNRYGVAAAGKFTKFAVPQYGQWYSGPAF